MWLSTIDEDRESPLTRLSPIDLATGEPRELHEHPGEVHLSWAAGDFLLGIRQDASPALNAAPDTSLVAWDPDAARSVPFSAVARTASSPRVIAAVAGDPHAAIAWRAADGTLRLVRFPIPGGARNHSPALAVCGDFVCFTRDRALFTIDTRSLDVDGAADFEVTDAPGSPTEGRVLAAHLVERLAASSIPAPPAPPPPIPLRAPVLGAFAERGREVPALLDRFYRLLEESRPFFDRLARAGLHPSLTGSVPGVPLVMPFVADTADMHFWSLCLGPAGGVAVVDTIGDELRWAAPDVETFLRARLREAEAHHPWTAARLREELALPDGPTDPGPEPPWLAELRAAWLGG